MPATPICRLALAAAVVLFAAFRPAPVSAQTMLRTDGDSCRTELKLLGGLIHASTDSAGLRPFASNCIASNLHVKAGGIEITAAKLSWNRGAIRALSQGEMPARLVLDLQGGRLAATPAAEPFARALAGRAGGSGPGRQGRSFSAVLHLSHEAESRRLRLESAGIRFGGGAGLAISADLSGAGALLASRPEIGALGLGIERLDLEMTAPPGTRHPLLDAILAAAAANNPGFDEKGLKGEAGRFLRTRMAGVLTPQELRAALAFLEDAPRLARPLHIGVQSDAGLALTRLTAFNGSAAGEDILSGTTITLEYGR